MYSALTIPAAILQQWNKLRRLSPADRVVVLQVIGGSLLLPILLRALSFRRTQALMLRLSPAVPPGPGQEQQVQRVVALTNRVCGWRIFRVNCVRRSLILWWLLRQRSIESALRIGVRQTTAGFEAHAWVEWNGRVLGERETYVEQFVPFDANFANHQ